MRPNTSGDIPEAISFDTLPAEISNKIYEYLPMNVETNYQQRLQVIDVVRMHIEIGKIFTSINQQKFPAKDIEKMSAEMVKDVGSFPGRKDLSDDPEYYHIAISSEVNENVDEQSVDEDYANINMEPVY